MKTTLRLMALILQALGILILVYVNWMIAIGIFVFIWGYHFGRSVEELPDLP